MIDIIQKNIEKLLILISSRHIPFDDELHGSLPTAGGVYRVFEIPASWKESIYVGQTGNLRDRIYRNLLMGDSQAHTLKRKLIANAGLTDKETVKKYLKDNCRVQYLEMDDENERSPFEHFVISILKPKYND